MSDLVQCRCGICVTHTLHDCYSFLDSLSHRGQEVTGIYAQDTNGRIFCLKWLGPPRRYFDLRDMYKIFGGSSFHTFGGHVRYATTGERDPRQLLAAGHPHVIGGEIINSGDHLVIRGAESALIHNGQIPESCWPETNPRGLRTECDSERLLHFIESHGPEETLRTIPGAYTLAWASRKTGQTIALRDPAGIRPGVLGQKDGRYVMASEDIALRKNGARQIEDLSPGAIYHFYPDGRCGIRRNSHPARRRLCFFELHYFAHVDSTIDGLPVQHLRRLLGQQLAKSFPFPEADLVTYLPRCPETAAQAYAIELGLPFANVFYKQNAGRSFIESTPGRRRELITHNLHLLPTIEILYQISENPIAYQTRDFLRGKTVVLIDDSIVRGNNSIRAQEILKREAGARKIIFLSYTPPVGIIGSDGAPRGCNFGVDMPPATRFVSRGRSEQQISRKLGMTVRQLSLEAMVEVYQRIGWKAENLCTFCIGGPKPFE